MSTKYIQYLNNAEKPAMSHGKVTEKKILTPTEQADDLFKRLFRMIHFNSTSHFDSRPEKNLLKINLEKYLKKGQLPRTSEKDPSSNEGHKIFITTCLDITEAVMKKKPGSFASKNDMVDIFCNIAKDAHSYHSEDRFTAFFDEYAERLTQRATPRTAVA